MQYKTLNSFKADLEVCYRSAIKEYKTQKLILKIQFYPNIKQTDTIKQRHKEIEIRIESLRQRLKKSKEKEKEVESKEFSLLSNTEKFDDLYSKVQNKIDKSISDLRMEEDKLKMHLESLSSIEKEIHERNIAVMNQCDRLSIPKEILSMSYKEDKETIQLILDKNKYIKVPCVTTVSDVIQLDGKIIEGSQMFRILLSLLYKYRHSKIEKTVSDNIYDVIEECFTTSYRNMIRTCVFHSMRKTGEFMSDNYPVAQMLSNL
jgi:hypothetical protein